MAVRYTVKQVSQLTGISTDLLRAWERRYGVVSPRRTASRYRLYGDDDVARLRRMAELVAAGSPASLAAEQVLSEHPPMPDVEDVPEGGVPVPARTPVPEVDLEWSPSTPPTTALPPVEALSQAARDLDRELLERTLDQVMTGGSFETIFDEWITPALVAVGDGWAAEEISVAGEHFVSSAVQRRLSQAFEAAGTAVNAPVVLVGLPPRTHHQLAALAFATCLRRRGMDVRYLGSDLPVESWLAAVRRLSPAAVTISVPNPNDSEVGAELVRALADAHPQVLVFAGGGGCVGWPEDLPVTLLPQPVTRAAYELAVTLVAGRSSAS